MTLRFRNYIIIVGWAFIGVIEQYDGDDATAGLKLSRNKLFLGKSFR